MTTARRPMKPVAGLSSLPKPFPAATSSPRPTEDQPAAVGEESPSPTPAPAKRAARNPSRPRSRTANTVRPVGLSLPGSLLEQLRARARSSGQTQPDVLMDAISSARENLGDLVDQDKPVQDGMFLRRPSPRGTEPLSTLTLRMLAPNVEVIDELVASTGAPSRSALCAAALRHYLSES